MELSKGIEGQLTISLFGENSDLIENESLIAFLETKAGRILFNQHVPEKAGFIHVRTKITPQGPKRTKMENYQALVDKGIL